MLSHISLGVSNIDKSRSFYSEALAPLGIVLLWQYEDAVGYGPPGGNDKLALFLKTETDVPLAAGPGFHLAFAAPSQKAVDQFYEAAIKAGGKDDGPPGLRPHYGPTYYAAFVFDPDGHKLEAVHQVKAEQQIKAV